MCGNMAFRFGITSIKICQTELKKKSDCIQFFFNAPQFVILDALVIPPLHKST